MFQTDKALECVDADAVSAAQGGEEEDDAGGPPGSGVLPGT
jgi:hypothetical protein